MDELHISLGLGTLLVGGRYQDQEAGIRLVLIPSSYEDGTKITGLAKQ